MELNQPQKKLNDMAKVYIYETAYRMGNHGPIMDKSIPEKLLGSEDVTLPGSLSNLLGTIQQHNTQKLKEAENLSEKEVFYLKTIRNQVTNL